MPKLPAYQKCYNKLKADIDNDVYPIGSFLPTEDELGKMFSVSRTTIRHAIDLLVRDRRIKVRQGAGTQVIDPRERELPSYSKFHNVISFIVSSDISVPSSTNRFAVGASFLGKKRILSSLIKRFASFRAVAEGFSSSVSTF